MAKNNNTIVTTAFRLAFPEVFEAKAGAEGGKEKFSVTMLFPEDGSSLIPGMPGNGMMELRKIALAAVKEKWGEDKAKWPNNLRNLDMKTYVSATGKDGWPIRDGNEATWTGFAGHQFARASSGYQPGVVDAKVKPVIDRSTVFGGLICRAEINAYAYDNSGNRGVTFGLSNLQILKDDGTVFSGRAKAEDVFDAFGAPPDTGAPMPGDDDRW